MLSSFPKRLVSGPQRKLGRSLSLFCVILGSDWQVMALRYCICILNVYLISYYIVYASNL